MNPEYFDIHSHINFPEYDADREEVLKRMQEHNVWTTTVGTNFETSKSAVESTKLYEGLFATIGLHPVDDPNSSFIKKDFETLVKNPKVVAIGECGLDYGRTGTATPEEKARQKKDFEAQIDFAVEYNKPLMLHVRSAHEDVLDILVSKKREHGDKLRANCHFFSGSLEIEKRYLDLGFSLSFPGVITFAKEYAEMVAFAPLDMIMSETDAPYVAPMPYRGKRNEPVHVIEVIQKIAEIKKLALVHNAKRFFNISGIKVA